MISYITNDNKCFERMIIFSGKILMTNIFFFISRKGNSFEEMKPNTDEPKRTI